MRLQRMLLYQYSSESKEKFIRPYFFEDGNVDGEK